jgi:hypothetical protein
LTWCHSFTFRFDGEGKVTVCNETVDSAYLNNLLAQDWVQQAMAKAMEEKR